VFERGFVGSVLLSPPRCLMLGKCYDVLVAVSSFPWEMPKLCALSSLFSETFVVLWAGFFCLFADGSWRSMEVDFESCGRCGEVLLGGFISQMKLTIFYLLSSRFSELLTLAVPQRVSMFERIC